MMFEAPPEINRANVRRALLALGFPADAKCPESARLLGIMETWIHDLLESDEADPISWEIHALETALGNHIFRRAGQDFAAVDFDKLARIVGNPEVVRAALMRLGFFARPVAGRDQPRWSDAPLGRASRTVAISFADVARWDGVDLLGEHAAWRLRQQYDLQGQGKALLSLRHH